MKATTPAIFLWWWWWWCSWWCAASGGAGGVAVALTSASPNEGNEDQRQGTSLLNEAESQSIIKRKLQETATNFKRQLKTQLNGVETEIYAEFLSILQDLENTQENITQEVAEKLRLERAEVLRKVDKVATYSSILVENLFVDLNKLLIELGIWSDEDSIDTSVLYSHHQELEIHESDPSSIPSFSSLSGEGYRSKRHMTEWNIDSDTRSQNIAKYEPFKEEELEEILASFEYMNSFPGTQDDLDTTLSDYTTPHTTMENPNSPSSDTVTPRDCLDLLRSGMAHDGVYTIYPTGLGVRVWCDMSSLGGGWTVVASRRGRQPQVNFSRPLLHYQFGFGDPETQHWLGLDHIHALTRLTNSTLRVVLQHLALDAPLHATYHAFSVGSREEGHRLTVGKYDPSSTADDALSPHSGALFTCPDPRYSDNPCVEEVEAGWWFLEAPLCYLTLPTGLSPSPEPTKGVRGALAWMGLQYPPETLLLMTRREEQTA